MTLFQIVMLGATAFFAFKIFEYVQSLEDPSATSETRREPASYDPEMLVKHADEAFVAGDLGRAKALLAEADVKAPNNPEILKKLGFVLAQEGDIERAIEHYMASLAINNGDDMVHNAIASLYREQKEYAKAKEHYEASLAIDSGYEVTYFNYANLLVEAGEAEEAKAMYEKALVIKPDFIQARFERDKLS